ncbi:MAG: DUF5667 domain-containing protein [Anaerolineales bacterium]
MIGKKHERALLLDDVLSQMQQRKTAAEDSLQAYPEAVEELRPLLETAEQAAGLLRSAGPSPEFLRASETRLLRKIRTAVRQDSRPRRTAPFAALWQRVPATAVVFVLAVALVLGSGWGVSTASAQALPGDALFPVKLGLEQVELAVTTSEAGDVALLAKFADRRMEEIQELVQQERFADLEAGFGEYGKALDRLDAGAAGLTNGERSAQLTDIQARLERHADILAGLRDSLPPQSQIALDLALARTVQSQNLAEQLRAEWEPTSIPTGEETPTSEDTGNGADDGASINPNGTDVPVMSNTPEYTNTPDPTDTDEPTKTDKPTKADKPTKTDKPTKPPKPTDPPEPTKTDKPTKTPEPK